MSYRDVQGINWNRFNEEVNDRLKISPSFGGNVTNYNEVLVLDDHPPLKSRVVKIVPNTPCFDLQYEKLRRLRRKAEKQYKRSNLPEHKDRYKKLRKQATELARENKSQYYADKLDSSNKKLLYSVVNELLDKNQDLIQMITKN